MVTKKSKKSSKNLSKVNSDDLEEPEVKQTATLAHKKKTQQTVEQNKDSRALEKTESN
jgi:hypothetical protein